MKVSAKVGQRTQANQRKRKRMEKQKQKEKKEKWILNVLKECKMHTLPCQQNVFNRYEFGGV